MWSCLFFLCKFIYCHLYIYSLYLINYCGYFNFPAKKWTHFLCTSMTHTGQDEKPNLDHVELCRTSHCTVQSYLNVLGSLFPRTFTHAPTSSRSLLFSVPLAWFTPTLPEGLSWTSPPYLEAKNMHFFFAIGSLLSGTFSGTW